MQIRGKLSVLKIGCKKFHWIIEDENDLYLLKSDDFLKVYSVNEEYDNIIWQGQLNLIHTKKHIFGYRVNNIQSNCEVETWYNMFHHRYNAILIRK